MAKETDDYVAGDNPPMVATDVSFCVTHGATDHDDGRAWSACRFRQLFYFENPMDEHTLLWSDEIAADGSGAFTARALLVRSQAFVPPRLLAEIHDFLNSKPSERSGTPPGGAHTSRSKRRPRASNTSRGVYRSSRSGP